MPAGGPPATVRSGAARRKSVSRRSELRPHRRSPSFLLLSFLPFLVPNEPGGAPATTEEEGRVAPPQSPSPARASTRGWTRRRRAALRWCPLPRARRDEPPPRLGHLPAHGELTAARPRRGDQVGTKIPFRVSFSFSFCITLDLGLEILFFAHDCGLVAWSRRHVRDH